MKKDFIARELLRTAKSLLALDEGEKNEILKKMREAQSSFNNLSQQAKDLLKDVERKEQELVEAKTKAKAMITIKPPKGMDDSDYRNWNAQVKSIKEAMDKLNDLGRKAEENTEDAKEFSDFLNQMREEFQDIVSKITAKESTKTDYTMVIELLLTYISNHIGKKVSAIAAETKNYTVVMGLTSGLLTDFRNSKLMSDVAAQIQARSDVVEGVAPNWEGEMKDRGWKIEDKSLQTFLDEASNRKASRDLRLGKERKLVYASKYRRAGMIDNVMKIWRKTTQKIKDLFSDIGKWISDVIANIRKAMSSADKLSSQFSDGMKVLRGFQKEMSKIK